MKSLRAAFGLLTALGLVLPLAGPARPEPQFPFQIVKLGTFGGDTSTVTDVNEQNVAVGYAATGQKDGSNQPVNHAFLYAGGLKIDLGTLGGPSSYATAVNDTNQVVGQAQKADGSYEAFLWQPSAPGGTTGTMTGLGTLPGTTTSWANDIDSHGHIVGGSNSLGKPAQAWISGVSSGERFFLTLPSLLANGNTYANSLNDSHQVVGSDEREKFRPEGASWQADLDNRVIQRDSFSWSPAAFQGAALKVNENGTIIGQAITGTPEAPVSRGFIAFKGQPMEPMEVMQLFSGLHTEHCNATGLNNADAVVGSMFGPDFQSASAAFSTTAPAVNLNGLFDATQIAARVSADINDGGVIAINGATMGHDQAALLFPLLGPGVRVTKVASHNPVRKGDRFKYTITARNNLPTPVRLRLYDSIPDDLVLQTATSADGGVLQEEHRADVIFPHLKPGQEVTLELVVDADNATGEPIVNEVFAALGEKEGSSLAATSIVQVAGKTPVDVTGQVRIQMSPIRNNRQTVTLVNPGPALSGPVYLALDNLKNATLANKQGVTVNVPPIGSPLLEFNLGSWKKGQKLSKQLKFKPKPGNRKITYTPRCLAGKGKP